MFLTKRQDYLIFDITRFAGSRCHPNRARPILAQDAYAARRVPTGSIEKSKERNKASGLERRGVLQSRDRKES
jgi:hypothetical protein